MPIEMQMSRVEQLRRLEPLAGDRPDAMIALARQFAGAGDMCTALDLAERASRDPRAGGEVKVLAAQLLGDGVPAWHFGLVRDRVRNRAYEEALVRAITPDCLVLEIGTGTGILAMMAARAGAKVVTCECNPAVALAARKVIAENGLSERIRLIEKHSTALDLAEDLGGKADILVSEIVSNDLLSEGVLPAHADACARLLKQGGRVIPGLGRVRTALAFNRRPAFEAMETVSGFDLSAFNSLARPCYDIPVNSPHLELRSNPADLFEIRFDGTEPESDCRVVIPLESTGGPINGIVQWLALDMDDAGSYENRPGADASSCWGALFWPLARAVETQLGEMVEIGAYRTQNRIRIWPNSL